MILQALTVSLKQKLDPESSPNLIDLKTIPVASATDPQEKTAKNLTVCY